MCVIFKIWVSIWILVVIDWSMNVVVWLKYCRNLMGCMGQHGTVLWGLVLDLLWPILLEGFYISPWIKNCTSFYLRPLYKKQIERGGEFGRIQKKKKNFSIDLSYKRKRLRVVTSFVHCLCFKNGSPYLFLSYSHLPTSSKMWMLCN